MSIESLHRKSLRSLLLIALLGILVFSGASAQEVIVIQPMASATFTVNTTNDTLDANPGDGTCADSSGQCSLRAAISESNFTDDADTITIPAGVYKITREGSDNTNESGDFDVLKNLTIQGAGEDQTIIDADGKVDIIFNLSPDVAAGVTVTMTNLTLTGASGGLCTSSLPRGGAIWSRQPASNLTLTSVTIRDNTVCGAELNHPTTITNSKFLRNDVGVHMDSDSTDTGNLTVENSQFLSHENGGVYHTGDQLTLTNSLMSDNGGAGVYIGIGTVNIVDSTIVRNRNRGISINSFYTQEVTVERTVIASNETTSDGAGISAPNIVLNLKDSLIVANSAGRHGGGLYANGNLNFSNVTIIGNSAAEDGGGMYINDPYGLFQNITVTDNTAKRGGGYFFVSVTNKTGVEMAVGNSIFAGNKATVQGMDCFDTVTGTMSQGNNIVGNDNDCNRWTGTGDKPDTNPNLAAELADNGGATCTIAIEAGSPAIDPAVVGTPTTADQRGAAAVGTRDIGAFEFNGVAQAKNVTCDYGNETPVAVEDAYVTQFGTQLSVSVGDGVLKNDTDADAGDTLTAVLKNNVSSGTMTFNSDGSFVYTPNSGFSGTDTFMYAAFDGQTESNVATVTLTVTEQPGSEPPQAPDDITVEPNQGRPTITWKYDVNAQWFQIWIGNNQGTVHFEWYPANPEEAFVPNQAPVSCNGIICSVKPNINPSSGSYDVWMQSWGYGSFATGGVSGTPSWNGPAKFTLSATAPGPVSGLTSTLTGTSTNVVTFAWQGSERATWYNVWVGTDGEADPAWQPFFFNWMLAEDLGCENAGICTLSNGVKLVDGSTFSLTLPSGEYIWYVQSWGPGGFSTGGSFDPPLDPWVEAPKFTVP